MLDELDRPERHRPRGQGDALRLRYDRGDIGLVRAARQSARLLSEALGSAHADAVELLVDELLTNAFQHGAPAFHLVVIRNPEETVVEVHDEHPSILFRWHEDDHRGLRIADRLSRGVEVEGTPTGKCVRAVIPADPWKPQPDGPRRRRPSRGDRSAGTTDGRTTG